jgi:hypothetical protein
MAVSAVLSILRLVTKAPLSVQERIAVTKTKKASANALVAFFGDLAFFRCQSCSVPV